MALALFAADSSGAGGAAAVPVLAPAHLLYGRGTALSGVGAAGAPVELQASAFPYRAAFRTIAQGVAGADGSFAFPALRPDRNTRYRVLASGMPSPIAQAIVSAPAAQTFIRLRDGRVRITLSSMHPPDLRWGGVEVLWFAAAVGSRHFALVAQTRTRELHPGLTYARASFYAPVGRFVYRACFNPPHEAAMGPTASHRRCPHTDFLAKHAAHS